MDRTNIKNRLPSRHLTAAVASGGSIDAALHLPTIADECATKFDSFDLAEIFKKTRCVADSKPAGRYVAKDMLEVAGRRFSGATRRSCIGHIRPEAAVDGPIALLRAGDIIEIDTFAEALNVKLTGAELTEHKTKRKARETNHTSGAPWKYAQQIGPAVDGAVTHPGEAHEKQCYANI